MTIQTLIVTVNQTDHSLLPKMNIQTDAIVGNQWDKNEIGHFNYRAHKIEWISTDTRGVGKNRNQVLKLAKADICVLADDDMIFENDYAKDVLECFKKHPDADILIFNLNGKKKRYKNTKARKIHRFNYGKYGAARIAFKTKSIHSKSLKFNTLFGGGCQYSCGEDTIFLHDCLKKGLKIVAVPVAIASIADDKSTWFCGYTDKYFFDRGVLYYVLNNRLCKIHALYHCLRYRKKYISYGWINALKQMIEGIESVKK